MRALTARMAEEHSDKHAGDVERSEKGREQSYGEDRRVTLIRERQDRIFAEKSAKWRATDQRQRAREEREERDGQCSRQSTHPPNVLFMMKHHDHRAGREKQERFKKRVSEKVEHRRVV